MDQPSQQVLSQTGTVWEDSNLVVLFDLLSFYSHLLVCSLSQEIGAERGQLDLESVSWKRILMNDSEWFCLHALHPHDTSQLFHIPYKTRESLLSLRVLFLFVQSPTTHTLLSACVLLHPGQNWTSQQDFFFLLVNSKQTKMHLHFVSKQTKMHLDFFFPPFDAASRSEMHILYFMIIFGTV